MIPPPCSWCGRDSTDVCDEGYPSCTRCLAGVPEPDPEPLPSHRVFRAVVWNPGATAREIYEALDAPIEEQDAISKHLQRLVDAGALRAEGTHNGRQYWTADASKAPRRAALKDRNGSSYWREYKARRRAERRQEARAA